MKLDSDKIAFYFFMGIMGLAALLGLGALVVSFF